MIELDGAGLASLRVGFTDDESVLNAADSCPMGAIAVYEYASGERAA